MVGKDWARCSQERDMPNNAPMNKPTHAPNDNSASAINTKPATLNVINSLSSSVLRLNAALRTRA